MKKDYKEPLDTKGVGIKEPLLRLTESDKWAYSYPNISIFLNLLLLLIILVPALLHAFYYSNEKTFIGPETFGISNYFGVVVFIALAALLLMVLKKFSRGVEDRWDEVERFIEYKSGCYAGTTMIYAALIIWGFAMWFPKYYMFIVSTIPLIVLFGYCGLYFLLRAKIRLEYEA